MNKQEYIIAIAENLNIDILNRVNYDLIEDCISQIPLDSMRAFMKHLANGNYEFKRPIEKLGKASKDFTDNLKVELCRDVEDKAKLIVDKCRSIDYYVYKNIPQGQNFRKTLEAMDYSSTNIFQPQEIEILKQIGTFATVILEHDKETFGLKIENIIKQGRVEHYLGIPYKNNPLKIDNRMKQIMGEKDE